MPCCGPGRGHPSARYRRAEYERQVDEQHRQRRPTTSPGGRRTRPLASDAVIPASFRRPAGGALRLALALLAACLAADTAVAFGRREAATEQERPAQPAAAAATTAAGTGTSSTDGDGIEALMQELGFQLPRRSVQAVGFDLQDLAGTTQSLDSYRGSVVFLNFWATWCAPCRIEMPAMQALHERLADTAGFAMVAVNLQEEVGRVRGFADELELSFQILLDSSGEIAATYGARTLPMSYVIDKDGSILARIIGIRSWDEPEFEQLFRTLASREPVRG